MIRRLYITILKTIKKDTNVSNESALINTKRLFIGSVVAIFLHIVQLLNITASFTYNTTWKSTILISNGVMLILWIVIFIISRSIRNRKLPGRLHFLLQYTAVIALMANGILIASADQLITSNITPYIMVCMISGTVLLLNPAKALPIFLLSYVIFFFAIGIAGQGSIVLITNRANGLTSTCAAMAISAIMWRYNQINIIQKRHIQTQQKQLEDANIALEKIAYSDPLTGLLNRRYFDDIVQKEASLMNRKGHTSCLIMLDLDFFKKINDAYGHSVGDSLLIQMGKLLSQSIRKHDTLCRLGGEEFIILLPRTSLDRTLLVAERLRKTIELYTFLIEEHDLLITASFGVAALSSSGENNLSHHYRLADNALYQAKHSGRNCVKAA